mgnify:CR=1 FL=1
MYMLGNEIKNLRKNKGMIQEELATRLHVVRQTAGTNSERGILILQIICYN